MPTFGMTSIRQETSQLNVSKGGATALYIDQGDANADDQNDGYSFDQPFESFAGIASVIKPWTDIFVKPGTYDDNVIIASQKVKIHGVVQDGADKVLIKPASGVPLTLAAGYCEVENIALESTNATALSASYPGQNLHDLYIEINAPDGLTHNGILLNNCDRAKLSRIDMQGNSYENGIGVLVDGDSTDVVVQDSYFEGFGASGVVGYAAAVNAAQRTKFIRNVFNSNYEGIYFYALAGSQLHTVIGNQFYNNELWDIDDNNTNPDVAGIRIINNFFGYTGFFDDSNHDGIADVPVQCHNNYDYAPLASPHFESQSFVPRMVA